MPAGCGDRRASGPGRDLLLFFPHATEARLVGERRTAVRRGQRPEELALAELLKGHRSPEARPPSRCSSPSTSWVNRAMLRSALAQREETLLRQARVVAGVAKDTSLTATPSWNTSPAMTAARSTPAC